MPHAKGACSLGDSSFIELTRLTALVEIHSVAEFGISAKQTARFWATLTHTRLSCMQIAYAGVPCSVPSRSIFETDGTLLTGRLGV